MKVRFSIFIFLFAYLATGIAPDLFSENNKSKKRVGVSPFEARSVEKEKANLITDLFRSYLLAEKVYEVLDRAHVQKTMRELEFQSSGMTDQENVVEMGKMLNAEFMIFGSLSKIDNFYRVSADIVEIKTGKLLNSVNQKFSDMNYSENVVKSLVRALVRGEKADEFVFANKIPDKDPAKIKKYLETKCCAVKNKYIRYKILGFTGNYDEIQEKFYGFLLFKEIKMPSGEETLKVISNIVISNVFTMKNLQKTAKEAFEKNKEYDTFGYSIMPKKGDNLALEYRIYQKKGKPSAIEIYLVTRNIDWSAKKPVTFQHEIK
ncbi:MAG: penicillin-binding protein activator LpoB [Spirochaetia bacterium]|nr:penicillin-binding protein activator LpoB [Spirochaetia bacterium]